MEKNGAGVRYLIVKRNEEVICRTSLDQDQRCASYNRNMFVAHCIIDFQN